MSAAKVRARGALALAALACAWSAAAEPLDAQAALSASRAAIGSEPADYMFTDSEGRRVSLASFRGKPLVVSVVYTGCTQVCPTTTRELAKAVRQARSVVGADTFNVASIGFNLPYDNPVSMHVFARQNDISDARWSFLTPDAGSVAPLARDLGFTYAAQAGGFDHVTQVTILDARGRVRAQIYGDSFALPMLVQPLRELALGEPSITVSASALLERARLLCTVYDPLSGKYRLDYGMFIELAVGAACLASILGFLLREYRRSRRPC